MIYRLLIIFTLTIASLQALASQSRAQNSNYSQSISDKLVKIATSNEKITQKVYNDFWRTTGVKSQQEKINLISQMRTNFLLIQQYNAILWECAEKSWRDSKVADCQKVNKNFSAIKNSLYNLLGDEEYKKIDFNFTNLMNVSAKRAGAFIAGGSQEEITLSKIQTAKATSQIMLQRVDIIMQPDFK